MAVPVNPLADLTDAQLFNGQLLLIIQCNRGKFATAKDRAAALCAIGTALKTEAVNRGAEQPRAPYSVGDLKKS